MGQGDSESGGLTLSQLPQAEPRSSSLQNRQNLAGTFTVVPGESVGTYTVREKLSRLPLPNDAVGRTTAFSGEIHLDGRPSRLTVDLRTLTSDQPQRDNYIRRRGGLLSESYPFAEFTVTELGGLPEQLLSGQTVRKDVTGVMKIREVERPFSFSVEGTMQEDTLQVLGTADFTWADFQIPPPNIARIVQVEDNVHIEVLLVAKREPEG